MLMASLIRWVSPEALPSLSKLHGTHGSHQHKVYVCLVGTEHLVERRDEHLVERTDAGGVSTGGGVGGGAAVAARIDPNLATLFDRSHYYTHPEAYVPTFHKTIAPHISILVTAMYWDCAFDLASHASAHHGALTRQVLGPSLPSHALR